MHETDDYSERKRKKRINIYAIANNQRIIVTAFSAEHTQTTIICGVINFCSYSINRSHFACESEAQTDLNPKKKTNNKQQNVLLKQLGSDISYIRVNIQKIVFERIIACLSFAME